MRRSSLIGPVLLIVLGVIFLINNLKPEVSLLRALGDYWPYLLIAWGGLRLLEILYWHFAAKPLPWSGISGGEWLVIVLIALIGGGLHVGHRYRDSWPAARITRHGIEIFGESYDFPLSGTHKAGKSPRILIENLRGGARVTASDTEEVTVTGRTTVRALDQAGANKVRQQCPFEMVPQGDLLVIRTNQQRVGEPHRVSSELEIVVPRGASVEGRGRQGDFEISGIGGSVDIDSDNAGVRLSDIGGNVRVALRKSDLVRAVNIKGNIELKGGGWDVDLDSIQGTTTVNGAYAGEIRLRKLAKPLRFQGRSEELRLERIDGFLRMTRGDLAADGLAGPVVLRARSKDVLLSNFTDSLELNVERGDVQVRPGRIPLARMDIRTHAGDIEFVAPVNARFQLRATTGRGEIVDNFGAPLEKRREGRGEILTGSVGGGGAEIALASERGVIRIYKAGADGVTPTATHETKGPPAPPVPPLTVQEQ